MIWGTPILENLYIYITFTLYNQVRLPLKHGDQIAYELDTMESINNNYIILHPIWMRLKMGLIPTHLRSLLVGKNDEEPLHFG